MTTPAVVELPGGKALCPGWDDVLGKHHDCAESRRDHQQVVEYPSYKSDEGSPPDCCRRCRTRKSKFDEDHGLREQRERDANERYNSLIAAYVKDVGSVETQTLAYIVGRLDALKVRSDFPPHRHPGEPGYRYGSWNEREVSSDHKLDILRVLAGLPVVKGRRW